MLSVHVSESHGTRYKYIVIVTLASVKSSSLALRAHVHGVGRVHLTIMLNVVVVMSLYRAFHRSVEVLVLLSPTTGILVRIVCHISSLLVAALEALLTGAAN